ncbi:hypothetical protein IMCC21224_1395 [Puniceibacterium sp. IMCC21224]|nr:hypothetical protein IMCC21224_1395 [Puniceibacterium sp. IMCC21224]
MGRSAYQSFARIYVMLKKLKSTSRHSRSCPVANTEREEYGLYDPRMRAFACVAGLVSYKGLRDVTAAQQSVVDLLEAVVPVIITPLHKD